MRSLIIAAALAVTAFVGIASAQSNCQTVCYRTNGGYSCQTRC